MTSHDLVVRPKRKQDMVSSDGEYAKKVAKTSSVQVPTTDRPRQHERIPGQYRAILPEISMPVPPSDDDDDYIPRREKPK